MRADATNTLSGSAQIANTVNIKHISVKTIGKINGNCIGRLRFGLVKRNLIKPAVAIPVNNHNVKLK